MTDEIKAKDEALEPSETPENLPPAEKTFSSAEMTKIIEREREKAEGRGYKRAKEEAQMEQQAQQSQQPQEQVQQPQTLGGMPQLSQADIERLIMQKAPEALMQQVHQLKNQNMVDSFVSKMQAAEQKDPGLESKLNQLNYSDPRMHKLIELANNLDNTAEIMKELVDNPNKLMQVLAGIQEQPFLAQESLKSLSSSIKQNQDAVAEQAQARNPMSQLKPSTSAGMDNGSMSVTDYRKMFAGSTR